MERDGLVWPQAYPLSHFQPVARDVRYVRVSPWRARSQLSHHAAGLRARSHVTGQLQSRRGQRALHAAQSEDAVRAELVPQRPAKARTSLRHNT